MVVQLNQESLLVDFQNLYQVFIYVYLYCIYTLPCYFFVLGESANFRLSTGIILTFLVNNKQDKALLTPALEWELKCVNCVI